MQANTGGWRRDGALLVLLLLAGASVKGWLMGHTEVVSRDGIHYIAFAAWLEHAPWGTVFTHTQQHPLYPIHVLAVAGAAQALTGRDDCLLWQFAAQLANVAAGVLALIPLYYLGRALFDRATGFAAALLFECLPVPARVTADALSEGTFLLWGLTAILLAAQGLRSRREGWFVAAGLTGGLAYLTRPEGAVVMVFTLLVLLVLVLRRAWDGGAARAAACAAALGLSCLVAVGPYWLTIQGLSPKPTFNRLLENGSPVEGAGQYLPPGMVTGLFASRLTPGVNGQAEHRIDAATGLVTVIGEIGKGFHYGLWAPAVAGLWLFRRRVLADPGLLLVATVVLGHTLVLWRLVMTAGYVSERHTLLIVACGLPVAVAALRAWTAWLPGRWAPAALVVAVAGLGGVGLARACKPLHPHRLAHKEAGFWLADRLRPGDQIVDPYGWVTYYSGRTLAVVAAHGPPGLPATVRYLVVDPEDTDLTRLRVIRQGTVESAPETVYAWPPQGPHHLIIYRQGLPRPATAGK